MKVHCHFYTFDQTFSRYQHNPRDSTSLSHNEVRTLYDDRQGTLWIGTGFPFFDDWKKDGDLTRMYRKSGTFHFQVKK